MATAASASYAPRVKRLCRVVMPTVLTAVSPSRFGLCDRHAAPLLLAEGVGEGGHEEAGAVLHGSAHLGRLHFGVPHVGVVGDLQPAARAVLGH